MRRSLAPHAAERMVRIEQREQLDEQLALLEQQIQQQLAAFQITPADTALLQRAERAERLATGWHRLAIALAVGCAVLVLIR